MRKTSSRIHRFAQAVWIASAVDLVKFASALDDPKRCPLLRENTIQEMWKRPEKLAGFDVDGEPRPAYYGCGWNVRPVGNEGKANNWHGGFITGTNTLLVRSWNGINWAILFNTQANQEGKTLSGLIDGALHEAAAAVKQWPEHDLFSRYIS